MEAKEYGNVGKKAIWFVKSLLCGYIVTGFLLLILALMLYKLGLSEQNVNAGIVLIYVISTFSAGFVLGKLAGKRKFLWGLFAGITYFVLLMLITLGVYHAFQGNVTNIAVTFLLCAGGGMLGGMIASKQFISQLFLNLAEQLKNSLKMAHTVL